MTASKKNPERQVELTGKVVMKKFGEGTKSEHDALCLETDERSFVLRRVGGNPFQDASLQRLKGKTVTAKGIISDYLFLATEINEC